MLLSLTKCVMLCAVRSMTIIKVLSLPDCREESIKFGIVGAIRHPQVNNDSVNYSKAPWAEQPTQMISYVSCHDDMCLVDRLKASIPGITPVELAKLDKLAQTAVFTSKVYRLFMPVRK